MAVQRRVNWLSQQRVDVPDMRAVESAASNDFDQLIQSFVTGTAQGYFMRGFNILMAGAIGGAANGLQMAVDPGAVLHIAASQSGTVLMVPSGTPVQLLNAATNTNVHGAFAPSSVNYVTLDYVRLIDDTTSAQVYLWDPTANDETTINAPRAQILEYSINISTSTPPSNLLPIAVVLTDAGNNVLSITDARWMLCRLGEGGVIPNPFFIYPWTQGRTENPVTSSDDTVDPFSGGDKNIGSLKEWMNAVMSSLLEIKGTTYWYSLSSSGSLESLREDLANTVITGSGDISHGILPNSNPVLTTTGDITLNSNQLINLASVVGVDPGDFIFGTGIPNGTSVVSVVGSTVTMSLDASITQPGITVSFYDPAVITAPGQINWDQAINIRVIGSALDYVIAANPTSNDISLTDDHAAYITLVRGVEVSPNLIFTNGVQQVTSVGAISWTGLLLAGDFLKLGSDTDAGYYKIFSVDSLTQVTLVSVYGGTSTGAVGAKGKYSFGSYQTSPAPSTNRHIYIAARALVPAGENVFWLFLRNDNGGAPRVYIRFLGVELDNGDVREISGVTSLQLLKYIGSPMASASQPLYTSALSPGSVPEITLFTFGTAAQTNQDSYFLLNASGNVRQYYVWFNKDGVGVDPNPGGSTNASIEVDISTGMTAAQIAAAVVTAISTNPNNDFLAVQQAFPNTNKVLITNTSAGVANAATSGDMISPFAIVVQQAGTGIGNFFIHDGDNLTLAIKELDRALGNFLAAVNEPSYDEPIDIVASGATPPTSLNGPIAPNTYITLPNNTRMGNVVQKYVVGNGALQIFLNGQYLRLGQDWLEVGPVGSLQTQFQNLFTLVAGDSVEIRLNGIGSGLNGGGDIGPPGPPGPSGPPGADAAGGPVAISTKTSNYTVLIGDCVLLANCSGGPITFNLPTVAAAVGKIFYFKKIDGNSANPVTLMGFSGQLIDASNTFTFHIQWEEFAIISNGTQWYVF